MSSEHLPWSTEIAVCKVFTRNQNGLYKFGQLLSSEKIRSALLKYNI